MLYVFFGHDTIRVRQAALDTVAALQERSSGLSVHYPEVATYEPGGWATAAQSQSLFLETAIYVIDNPSQQEVCFREFMRDLSVLNESTHHFVVIEGALSVADKKAVTKEAFTISEYKKDSVDRFDTFALADALARRDKRSLWMLLQEAGRVGLVPEEVIGMLWWQLKALRLASCTTSAAEAGMKEYPYKKAKQALRNFAPDEVVDLSRSLLTLYHAGHAGERDIALALEEWVLRL